MIATLHTPCGRLFLYGDASKVVRISWSHLAGRNHAGCLDWAVKDLYNYFQGKTRIFTGGLDFWEGSVAWIRSGDTRPPRNRLQEVLYLMSMIPYGTTVTYGDLARSIGGTRYSRFVGQVCRLNPLPVIIPCHRVVARDSIGGYSYGIKKKRCLLELEGYRKYV
ncbi:MAG: methylated-DNA--[protein]-cysteine S-methyltransferase [Deltaproteobacteria bacterium]|nr:MAG: methylated-DNA--[protein]-cysteine S-methyltransferase [Deltaproteobacteria bacterium]